jgi:hypothetical protein
LGTYIAIKWKILKEMDKFLDTYDNPKLNQKDINHLNRSITHNEKKKKSRTHRYSAEFYQTFKEELI